MIAPIRKRNEADTIVPATRPHGCTDQGGEVDVLCVDALGARVEARDLHQQFAVVFVPVERDEAVEFLCGGTYGGGDEQ